MNVPGLETEIQPGMICPVPLNKYPHVLLAHGGGGRLMHQLIETMFKAVFRSNELHQDHDAALLTIPQKKIAFTTDSYVVQPLLFPGGNIGTLAVNGTVNDLAMAGARPLYLSIGFILEEGLPMATLWQIVQSIQKAAQDAHVSIVTGDTKVIDRAKGDGIYINTAGIGIIEHEQTIAPREVCVGDSIIVNGDLGNHGMAIMAVREGLSFETTIESDCAPLAELTGRLLAEGIDIHCLRDLTRGGLASALNEIAAAAHKGITIEESRVPVRDEVACACELLGLDPLYVANEGRFIAFLPADHAEEALRIMRQHPLGQNACVIGNVNEEDSTTVTSKSTLGIRRILDMISGEQLPRIC